MKFIITLLSVLIVTTGNAQTLGIVIGNSTVAAYLGGTAIADYLHTPAEITAGYSVLSIATPGNTINQQYTAWDSIPTQRALAGWVGVEIALNDMITPSESSATVIARYQALINHINATKKVGAKVMVSTMTPAKQRFIDLLGSTDGAAAYQKWLDVNDAIMGNGAHAVTGVDYRVNAHTALLNDGNGNLAAQYEIASDHIHENNTARQIIANSWRNGLFAMGILTNNNLRQLKWHKAVLQ